MNENNHLLETRKQEKLGNLKSMIKLLADYHDYCNKGLSSDDEFLETGERVVKLFIKINKQHGK